MPPLPLCGMCWGMPSSLRMSMRVAAPSAPEGAPASGTCVIALLPLSPSRTLLHIRERHQAFGRERALVWAGVAAESLSSLSMLRDLRDACVAHVSGA